MFNDSKVSWRFCNLYDDLTIVRSQVTKSVCFANFSHYWKETKAYYCLRIYFMKEEEKMVQKVRQVHKGKMVQKFDEYKR